jgi:subtilase family serine protease
VDTTDSTYGTSALAVFDATFGLLDPPSLTFVDHTGLPPSSSNNSSNHPEFGNYRAGPEIALDIKWAHAMAPAARIEVLCAAITSSGVEIVNGIATLASLPGVSVISVSYGLSGLAISKYRSPQIRTGNPTRPSRQAASLRPGTWP